LTKYGTKAFLRGGEKRGRERGMVGEGSDSDEDTARVKIGQLKRLA
jgi:hypothetical protein